MCLVRRLHLDRSCASSSDNPLSDKSFLMLSIHLRFGLPLLLFPDTSIPNTLFPTYSSSLLETCPYHFNLLSCTFLDISPTFVVPLILSFIILSCNCTSCLIEQATYFMCDTYYVGKCNIIVASVFRKTQVCARCNGSLFTCERGTDFQHDNG